MSAGFVTGQPRGWLRAEGLIILVVATTLYGLSNGAWVYFAVLFFAPDLSFTGYLAGPGTGAWIYNVAHSYVGPLVFALALLAMSAPATPALIWIAHIGFDRVLGYGLKYPSAFHDTHLGRIGRVRTGERRKLR